MKNLKWLLIAILLATMTLAVIACGSEEATTPTEATQAQPAATQAQAQPTNTQAAPATDTPMPEPTAEPTEASEPAAEAEAELDTTALAGEQGLDSYRSTTLINIMGTKDGREVAESIEMVNEVTRNPAAQHITMSTSSTENMTGTGTIEIYQVEGMQYMNMGGQWFSNPVTDTNDLSTEGFMTGDELLNDACGWKKEGKAEIEGVEVEHWTLDKAGMDKCPEVYNIGEEGVITDGGGNLYIAVEGQYIALLEMFYAGKDLDLLGLASEDAVVEDGRMEMSFAVTDVNKPLTITVPEEALATSQLPEDIPTPADAEGVAQMFGMITFTSASTPQEIGDWYKAEMPKNGWAETSSGDLGGTITLEFTKDARTVNFMIMEDTNTGKTQVLITVSEQ